MDSDLVLVMHEGRITGQLHRGEMLTEEAVMHLATGGSEDAVA